MILACFSTNTLLEVNNALHFVLNFCIKMPPNRDQVLRVCTLLAEQENLKTCVSGSAKGALLTGCCTFAGGILGGPVGLAVGGTLGSIGAAYLGRSSFKSVVDVIRYDMTADQKRRLGEAVQHVLENVQSADAAVLLAFLSTNQDLKALVINEVGSFLANEMRLSIVR